MSPERGSSLCCVTLSNEMRLCSHSAFQLCGTVGFRQHFLPKETHVQNMLPSGRSRNHHSIPASLTSCTCCALRGTSSTKQPSQSSLCATSPAVSGSGVAVSEGQTLLSLSWFCRLSWGLMPFPLLQHSSWVCVFSEFKSR